MENEAVYKAGVYGFFIAGLSCMGYGLSEIARILYTLL
jgi:hypothetical protein